MARPRDPAALQKLKGVDKKNKKRMREEPTPSGPLGDPPAYLENAEKKCWYELERIVPARVLTNADRIQCEIIARLWAQMIEDGIGGKYGLSNGQLAALNVGLSKLGLTPADRSKVTMVPEKPTENEFSEFAAPQGDKANKGQVN